MACSTRWAALLLVVLGLRQAGQGNGPRGTNFLDSGAPFYEVYACADGAYVSIAPIEDKVCQQLLHCLTLAPDEIGSQWDQAQWPRTKKIFADRFRQRTRAEWEHIFAGKDV